MEFILKKDQSGKSTAQLKEIADLLEISHLKKQIRDFQLKFEDFKLNFKPDKKDLLQLLSYDMVIKGDVIDISNTSVIEKDDTIKEGAIYYNKQDDVVRIKMKKGWTSLKTE